MIKKKILYILCNKLKNDFNNYTILLLLRFDHKKIVCFQTKKNLNQKINFYFEVNI